ncbi:extracellular solute-binding protein family 1 [Candidatus Vecturithrix granuli]|uniref:Extracellular solute-binding protein family 1 n=1 Tax=Vecturithrix granuli TaxID=1499967 RepID=A0A081C4P0_VECG1|nr:extracellular solute-binding protein family 1 [Candidatus Vecturithrix granuli]
MNKIRSIAVCFLIVLSFSLLANAQTITVATHSGHNATPWYNEANTLKEKYGIELNVVEITPDEIYSREVLELTQQTGAYDIIQYNSAWVGDYEPYILPLDDYAAKDNDAIGFADILPAFNKAQNLWGGKKVSVTIDGDTFLFYYRKDLFQNAEEKAAFQSKYGYELPDPPTTWQQVVDLAQFFTRKKGETLAGQTLTKDFYGYADQAKRGRVYYWYLFRFVPFNAPNPHYFDPDTMEPKINSEGAVAALENMKELLKYSPPGVLSWEWDELYTAAMNDGTVGMWIHWTDEGRGFNQLAPLPVENPPAPELGIATNPGVEVDGKVYQYTIVDSAWVASICKDSKNPDAAYTVLKHMFGPGPVNLGYIMNPVIGWDPSRYSHFNSEEWRKAVPGIEKYLELELKALEYGYPMIKIPGAFEYNDVLDLNVSKFLAGDIATAKETLDTVAARWQELNQKFGVEKQKGFYAKMWQ